MPSSLTPTATQPSTDSNTPSLKLRPSVAVHYVTKASASSLVSWFKWDSFPKNIIHSSKNPSPGRKRPRRSSPHPPPPKQISNGPSPQKRNSAPPKKKSASWLVSPGSASSPTRKSHPPAIHSIPSALPSIKSCNMRRERGIW